MSKKAIVAVLLAFVLFTAPAASGPFEPSVYAQGTIQVQLNGTPMKLSTPAILLNKTTLVPLREIAEALGATVSWGTNAKQQTVVLERGNRTASLTLDSPLLILNGKAQQLAVAPQLIDKVTRVPLRALSESLGTVVSWDGLNKIVHINEPKKLPVIGTQAKLDSLLKQLEQNRGFSSFDGSDSPVAMEMGSISAPGNVAAPSAQSSSDRSNNQNYSPTNTQVEGVDEADWAKTDGKFIYQLSNSRVLISDITAPSAPTLSATIEYSPEEGFYPKELYIDQGQIIVIGEKQEALLTSGEIDHSRSSSSHSAAQSNAIVVDQKGIMPYFPMRSTVEARIYAWNTAMVQPELIREIKLDGQYMSSRKIDSSLYIVTNKYNYSNSFELFYGDTAVSPTLNKLSLEHIHYFPDSPDSSTLLIGALDLAKPEKEMQVSAYLGSGQMIYASTKHLYVAIAKSLSNGESNKQATQLHKFRLDQGSIMYIGEGSVPGTILNQFSMDEHEGYFRVTTTSGNMWARGSETSSNNLYVLDEQLTRVGALENLAPGERIYSTRFMGSRAYMVTFRNVDPLFVMDLSNPYKPSVLGQLKIPGYSDYLHPYDENHIIGFGKETIELSSQGMGPDDTMAFYQGLKIALFDVSDVSHPKEKFKEILGDRGTSSELLHNHKALLFSKAKGLLAFPVELMEIKDKKGTEAFPAYGQFSYQGAYVYHLDLEKGFDLRGRITHLTQEDLNKSGQYGFDYSKSVRRILLAGSNLYTLSDRILKVNDQNSIMEIGALTYPEPLKQITSN